MLVTVFPASTGIKEMGLELRAAVLWRRRRMSHLVVCFATIALCFFAEETRAVPFVSHPLITDVYQNSFSQHDFKGTYTRFLEIMSGSEACPHRITHKSNGTPAPQGILIPHESIVHDGEQCTSGFNMLMKSHEYVSKEEVGQMWNKSVANAGIDTLFQGILTDLAHFYIGEETSPRSCGESSLSNKEAVLFTGEHKPFMKLFGISFPEQRKIMLIGGPNRACAFSASWDNSPLPDTSSPGSTIFIPRDPSPSPDLSSSSSATPTRPAARLSNAPASPAPFKPLPTASMSSSIPSQIPSRSHMPHSSQMPRPSRSPKPSQIPSQSSPFKPEMSSSPTGATGNNPAGLATPSQDEEPMERPSPQDPPTDSTAYGSPEGALIVNLEPQPSTSPGPLAQSHVPPASPESTSSPSATPSTSNEIPPTSITGSQLAATPVPDSASTCFPADANVELHGGRRKRMDELMIGDRVRVGPNLFSTVFAFTHKLEDVTSDFVKISTAAGPKITLSRGHYIHVNGQLTAAGAVRPGDLLQLGAGPFTSVNNVTDVRTKGLYNPQTMAGDVVVNGILASTYTTAVEPHFAHALLSPLRFLHWVGLKNGVVFQTLEMESVTAAVAKVLPRGRVTYKQGPCFKQHITL